MNGSLYRSKRFLRFKTRPMLPMSRARMAGENWIYHTENRVLRRKLAAAHAELNRLYELNPSVVMIISSAR